MKFSSELPPEQSLDIVDAQYVRFPKIETLMWVGVGLGVLGTLLAVAPFWEIYLKGVKRAADDLEPIAFVSMVIIWLFVHEVLHGLTMPGGLLGKRTVIGLRLRQGIAYCWNGNPMSRNRYILAALFPLFSLGILPVALYLAYPEQLWPVLPFCLMNMAASGADILVVHGLVKQVPTGGWIQLSGTRVYHGKRC